ncbi:fructose-bisphosphate aldolase, chloroplastic-like [Gossypium hirsutum]|uniref:fructose-bisphosphate aldolase n=1 Tax=Gossypium hirsutum TaxID=3635 RepID=A0A1U8MD41_GOSHI|nr:fructose-bisphosphate aldolase, chloroplastic-like [Gossypium hirsutum]
MDESSATCRERLASIGLENTEANHQAYRTCLFQLSDSGAILFEETLCQSTADSEKMVDVLVEQNIVPAPIKDNGLVSVVELEILLDGDFGIGRTFEVAKKGVGRSFLLSCPEQCDVQRALQNACLKKWESRPENVKEAQDVLLVWAKANSLTQLGKYTGKGWSDEAKQGMFVKGYVY